MVFIEASTSCKVQNVHVLLHFQVSVAIPVILRGDCAQRALTTPSLNRTLSQPELISNPDICLTLTSFLTRKSPEFSELTYLLVSLRDVANCPQACLN